MESPQTAGSPGTGRVCPKCHYVRQPQEITPDWECPACHIVYDKFVRALPQATSRAIGAQPPAQLADRQGWQRLVGLAGLLLLTIAVAIQHFRPVTATDFHLPDLAGKTQRLRDQYGKVVLLNFWATWCAACLAELPAFEQLSVMLQSQPFTLWTVNLQEHPVAVGRFLEAYRLQLPVLFDLDGTVSAGYGVHQIPTTFLIDCGGKIADTIVGTWNAEANEALLDLLQKSKHDERCQRPGTLRI